jgi:signal transduction histidine kinase/tetratricopeptide (TPR) repeat protein
MKKIRGTRRNRIIIYYLLAIVVPSIVLGMLAFRGVKNDQALVEREQRRALQSAGRQINDSLDAILKQIEINFLSLPDSLAIPENITFSDSNLFSFVNSYPIATGVFYISERNEVAVLNNNLLYVPDKSLDFLKGREPGQFRTILEYGWQMEFVRKEYLTAIDYYRKAMPDVGSDQDRAEIYNAIARLQKKLGRFDEALSTYSILINNYSDFYIQNNIPLGMAAMFESGNLYLQIQDIGQCLEIVDELLVNLEGSRWPINYPTYANIISKITEMIGTIRETTEIEDSLFKKPEAILEKLSLLEDRTAYLLTIPELAGAINSAKSSGSNIINNRLLLEREGQFYFIFLSPSMEKGQWGIVYNQEKFLYEKVYPYVMDIAGGVAISWKLINNYGKQLIISKNFQPDGNPVNYSFSSALPPWTLVFYPKEGGLLASLVRSGQGIFFYIFLLIVIILGLGLFFTLYVTNNELSLAKMRSNFITTVTHEFKSPLTSIRQMAEMLEGGRVPSRERQQKYFGAMVQESERLSHLIDNILDFSRMEAGMKEFHFEKDNLACMTEEMVQSFQSHLADKGFQIDFKSQESIPDSFFDRNAIKQVIQNLMDNACKYSGNSKKIEVKVASSESDVTLSVRDFGIGIRKDEQDKIFSQFYRAGDELSQQVKGSGIGLTIVKQIVDAHKGHIILMSEPGNGSEFRIVLPLEKN